ncbi:MMPL family transporter [Gammaproteobacteria bacterium]|nr:MMPL family transporter [Gammaproteobacteria bacterium]
MFFEKYIKLVLGKPYTVLGGVLLLTLFLGWNTQQFRMDASADSLVVEGDADLEYSRLINSRYGAGDFVFVTYAPDQGLFTSPSLRQLKALKSELEQIASVESVDSIFDVPLFKVANVSLSEITDNIIILESAEVDLSNARDDLMSSDAYRNVLLSEDGLTTALIVNFTPDTALALLLEERTALRELDRTTGLTASEAIRLEDVEALSTAARVSAAKQLHEDIADIRITLEKYRDSATIYLGGVPMIADDLVTFVRNDLFTFGAAILFFIIASLAYLFRKARYVAIPLLCGSAIAICVIGLLGLMDWAVTVISSNFISLLLIITVSLTVHLIVRFRELEVEQASLSHHERLKLTLQSMIKPCAYTSLTTIVAFGSLVISDIPPIIDFGWMMVMGVCCAFLLTFLIFPAVLGLLPESNSRVMNKSIDITPSIGRFTQSNGPFILLVAGLLFIASSIGITRLQVENSFIDYFDDSTEIYQGMVAIDQNMGGTTPLDVIIDMRPPNPFDEGQAEADFGDDPFAEDEYFDEFDDFGEEEEGDAAAYWFTSDKMQEIIAIHDYLDALPETGKVLSLATLLNIAYELNEDEPLNSIELAVLYNKIPDSYKESLLKPYVSVADDQIRFSIRVLETSEGLVRADLLKNIRQGLSEEFGYSGEQVHLTGMLVLYNNMLQSLFESQILTLGMVLLVITAMFLVLFRSWKLALIGIIPNILAALSVLGLMGWLGIPLDMMTITIAAISVGIGVDNTIHYMHRFKSRFPEFNNYVETMTYCHGSIGKAMYYTGFTIVAGFSILILSNFIPTIYFGLLTSLAMCLALTGALTLLPQLLIVFKPLKEQTDL